jgi:ATP-binding cassette subfamily B protein
MPSIYIIIGLMTILSLLIGGIRFINGTMALDIIVTLLSYIASLGFPLMMLGQIMLIYIQADAALTRVRDILESSPEIKDLPEAIPISNLRGDIEFDNVSFEF